MLARPVLALVLAALLAACGPPRSVAQNAAALAAAAPEAGLAEVASAALYRPLAELAPDADEGRGTGTRGEEMAVEYIAEQMRALGLEGGAAAGSFFRRVPLRGATAPSVSPLVLTPDDTEPV